jgi:hypothetical protein
MRGQGAMGQVRAFAERTGSEAAITASTVANIVSFPLKGGSWARPNVMPMAVKLMPLRMISSPGIDRWTPFVRLPLRR